jgi:hypothetical protein
LDKIKTSLSKDSGEEFLEKIETFNPNLKQHINRDFINLIYEFREKVIHQDTDWSNCIKH